MNMELLTAHTARIPKIYLLQALNSIQSHLTKVKTLSKNKANIGIKQNKDYLFSSGYKKQQKIHIKIFPLMPLSKEKATINLLANILTNVVQNLILTVGKAQFNAKANSAQQSVKFRDKEKKSVEIFNLDLLILYFKKLKNISERTLKFKLKSIRLGNCDRIRAHMQMSPCKNIDFQKTSCFRKLQTSYKVLSQPLKIKKTVYVSDSRLDISFSLIFINLSNHNKKMEINLDLYIRNFRIFYQQLIKDHKKQQELNSRFKTLVQSQNRKWKKAFNFRRQTNNTREDSKMLNKLKQKKNGKSKITVDVLYASQKIEYMIVFGYFFIMLEYKNASAFHFLCDNLRQALEKRGLLSEVMQRRINYFWDKIDQVVSGKRRLARIQKILQDSFKDLPTNLLDIFYQIILQGKQFVATNETKYMQGLSTFLSVKIDYFILDQDENIKIATHGNDFKLTMRFGYFKKDKFYGYVSKMPEKQQSQINNEITLQKFATISENLNKMYTTNLRQYLTLSNLKTQNKMVRSNSLFSSASNQPQTYTQNNQSEYTNI